MLNSIRSKDKTYKIKKVIVLEDTALVNSNEIEEKEIVSIRPVIRRKIIDLDSADDDDDDENEQEDTINKGSKKKKNGVREYKEALSLIGSKSNGSGSSMSTGKKLVDKVIISESEYNLNDKWLINDIEKKFHGHKSSKAFASSSKRKYSCNSELEERDDYEAETAKKLDSDEDDFDFLLKNKKSNNKTSYLEKIAKSPISKKRFVESNYEERQRESLEIVKETQHINLSDNFQYDCLDSDMFNNFQANMDFESTNKSLPSLSPTKKLKGTCFSLYKCIVFFSLFF